MPERRGGSDGTGKDKIERLQAMRDVLLEVARLYVNAFGEDEAVTLPERLRLQQVEDILADPEGWSPNDPISGPMEGNDVMYVVKMDTPSMGKGVLVTQLWDEAAADIKEKVDAGCRVIVEPAVVASRAGDDRA